MKLIPLIVALWTGVIQIPLAWKRLPFYSKLAIIGFVIAIIGTSIGDSLTGVIRNYTVRGEVYTQTIGDLVNYLSGDGIYCR